MSDNINKILSGQRDVIINTGKKSTVLIVDEDTLRELKKDVGYGTNFKYDGDVEFDTFMGLIVSIVQAKDSFRMLEVK